MRESGRDWGDGGGGLLDIRFFQIDSVVVSLISSISVATRSHRTPQNFGLLRRSTGLSLESTRRRPDGFNSLDKP